MINDDWRVSILKSARKYCKANGLMLSTLGRHIVNDGDFFLHLENGGGCTVDKLMTVQRWFKENKKTNSKHQVKEKADAAPPGKTSKRRRKEGS